MVETNHLKISRRKDPGCVGAVSSLLKVFDASGSIVLGQVLRTIRDAYASDPDPQTSAPILEGLGQVFNRYNGKTNEKAIIAALSKAQHGVRGLMQRATAKRERTGNSMTSCVAGTVVELYNKTVPRQAKLASWWQQEEEAAIA